MSFHAQLCFWSEAAAHARLEEIVWPSGPVCPHCGSAERIGQVVGKGARAGLRFCCNCRKQFRATMGTMFEGSHVPLTKWFQACFLFAASGGRIGAHQLHQRLEVTHKTALRMLRRLRGGIGEGPVDLADRTAPRPLPAASTTAAAAPADRHRGRSTQRARLPWITSAPLPRRQYFAFAEAAQGFDLGENDARFDALLAILARRAPASRPRPVVVSAWTPAVSP
jgi:transposase-like protein